MIIFDNVSHRSRKHVNICNQHHHQCWGCLQLLGAFGGDFGQRNKLFSVQYFIFIFPALSASHQGAGLDGWRKGVLDDTSVLGSAIRIDAGASELNGLVFTKKKRCILLTTVCKTKIHLVLYVWRGRNGWMAEDSVGCSCHFRNFQIRMSLVEFQYSYNSSVNSYSIKMRVGSLESH